MTDNAKPPPHIDTTQVAVSANLDTPQTGTVLSPLPNIPTFIKLFGQPETKEKENDDNDWDDKIDSSKPEILDIIDANDEDPFTLETFISLIMLYVKEKKDFIISRVKTADPNEEGKFYYSYYAAHHINKVIFRTQPELSLLHRMRAKNPLNNMTIVDDVYYYVVKYEEAKKVIGNIKSKLKLELKQPPKSPLSPLFITPIREENNTNSTNEISNTNNTENENENSDKHHIRSKSSPIRFVSNISSKAPRSVQRLLVRTGMAPLQAYPELMTRNNLRLIMKPEGLEPDPIIQSATISNDEFNADDLFQNATTTQTKQPSLLSKIKDSLGKKKDKNQEINDNNKDKGQEHEHEHEHEYPLNDNYGSSIALLSDNNTNNNTTTKSKEIIIDSKHGNVIDESSTSTGNPAIDTTQYSQYVIDLGNEAMTSEKTTSPKSAISSCPYPAYSKNLLQIHTTSYLNDRNSKLNIYDWIKVHSTSPLSMTSGVKIDELFSKKYNNKNKNDEASVSTDETKTDEKNNNKSNDNDNSTCITIEEGDKEKEDDTEIDKLTKDKKDALNEIKEIIFEAPFYATDDDFLMKSSVRAYFKQNALEPDDAVLFTLPSLTDNVIMLDGEQHPALANFNYVLENQMRNETRVLVKINKSLKWLLICYLVFAFVLIKIWVPTNIVVIIMAIGIFVICFFLMICSI